MRVLHIGDEMSWRGGENQIRFLIEGLQNSSESQHHVAYPRHSRGIEVFKKIGPSLELPSRKPDHPLSVFKLIQYVKHHDIQILDAQSSGGHSLALWVKRYVPHLKLVVHRRVDNPIKTNWLSQKKYLHKSIDQYVAISDCIGKILQQYGVPNEKISVVHSAIDPSIYQTINRATERAEFAKKYTIPENKVWVGNASAFTFQKDPVFLIHSLNALFQKGLSFQCLLAGDGPLLKECQKLVSQYGIADRVHFLGHIKNVPQLLSSLDVLLFPSANEGLGTLLLDSISAGTVALATQVGGIPEIIIDGETGLSVAAGDQAEFVSKASQLIENEELRRSLVERAQTHIAKNFSISNMIEGNLRVYQQLLSQ